MTMPVRHSHRSDAPLLSRVVRGRVGTISSRRRVVIFLSFALIVAGYNLRSAVVDINFTPPAARSPLGDDPVNAGMSSRRGTVYTCGVSADNRGPQWTVPLASALFPDYEGPVSLPMKEAKGENRLEVFDFSADDVLVTCMSLMHCPLDAKKDFPGKVLIYSIEMNRNVQSEEDNVYYIGPFVDGAGGGGGFALLVYFAAIHLLSVPAGVRSKVLPPVRASLSEEGERIGRRRDRFAAYVVSRCHADRERAAIALNEIRPVDAGGSCRGEPQCQRERARCDEGNWVKGALRKIDNAPTKVGGVDAVGALNFDDHELQMRSSLWANIRLYEDYRFVLAMENKSSPGYITEKILNAFLGGAIPIYYGTEEVFDVFNRDAFVYYNVSDPEPALAQIRFLEENATAYDEMLSRPALAEGAEEKYFSLSSDIGGGKMKDRIRIMMGLCCP